MGAPFGATTSWTSNHTSASRPQCQQRRRDTKPSRKSTGGQDPRHPPTKRTNVAATEVHFQQEIASNITCITLPGGAAVAHYGTAHIHITKRTMMIWIMLRAVL